MNKKMAVQDGTMLKASDQEKVVKSSQTANLLVQDLRELVKAANPLLADIGLDVLEQAVKVENRLKRLESVSHECLKRCG